MKRIFVSSTFKDMQFERDILHEQILPQLQEFAAQYGESVSLCDLRWGVNTADMQELEASRKVLSVCLDEIEKCRPYMIVILGDRYGWIPDEDLLQYYAEEKADFAAADLRQSVTSLEIEYGALQKAADLERVLFFFREFDGEKPEEYGAEDELHARKLAALKKKIQETPNAQITSYHVHWNADEKRLEGTGQFAALVQEQLLRLLKKDLTKRMKLHVQERERLIQWNYAGQKAAQFGARHWMLKTVCSNLEKFGYLQCMEGGEGSGKTTLMAKLAAELKARDWEVIPVFAGISEETASVNGILCYLRYALETLLGVCHDEEKAYQSRLLYGSAQEKALRRQVDSLIGQYGFSEKKRLVILVDGAERLFSPGTSEEELSRLIPDTLSNRVKMLLALPDHEMISAQHYVQRIRLLGEEKEIKGMRLPTMPDFLEKMKQELLQNRVFWQEEGSFDWLSDGENEEEERLSDEEVVKMMPQNVRGLPFYYCSSHPEQAMDQTFADLFGADILGAEIPEPDEEKAAALRQIAAYYGRELDSSVLAEIIQKTASGSPLYLELALQRLNMMDHADFAKIRELGDGMEAISLYQRQLIRSLPDETQRLCTEILRMAARKIHPEFMAWVLALLAAARDGLREEDLKLILEAAGSGWQEVDFALFMKYTRAFWLKKADGCYLFAHPCMREGLLRESGRKAQRQLILAGLKKLPQEDSFRRREILFYSWETGDMECFVRSLCELSAAPEDACMVKAEMIRILERSFDQVAALVRGAAAFGADGRMVRFFLNELLTLTEEGSEEAAVLSEAVAVLAQTLLDQKTDAENVRNALLALCRSAWAALLQQSEYGLRNTEEKIVRLINNRKKWKHLLGAAEGFKLDGDACSLFAMYYIRTDVVRYFGQIRERLTKARSAYQMALRQGESCRIELAQVSSQLAMILRAFDLPESVRLYEEADALYQELLSEGDMEAVPSLTALQMERYWELAEAEGQEAAMRLHEEAERFKRHLTAGLGIRPAMRLLQECVQNLYSAAGAQDGQISEEQYWRTAYDLYSVCMPDADEAEDDLDDFSDDGFDDDLDDFLDDELDDLDDGFDNGLVDKPDHYSENEAGKDLYDRQKNALADEKSWKESAHFRIYLKKKGSDEEYRAFPYCWFELDGDAYMATSIPFLYEEDATSQEEDACDRFVVLWKILEAAWDDDRPTLRLLPISEDMPQAEALLLKTRSSMESWDENWLNHSAILDFCTYRTPALRETRYQEQAEKAGGWYVVRTV